MLFVDPLLRILQEDELRDPFEYLDGSGRIHSISTCAYADDILLLSSSVNGAKQLMQRVIEFCTVFCLGFKLISGKHIISPRDNDKKNSK